MLPFPFKTWQVGECIRYFKAESHLLNCDSVSEQDVCSLHALCLKEFATFCNFSFFKFFKGSFLVTATALGQGFWGFKKMTGMAAFIVL